MLSLFQTSHTTTMTDGLPYFWAVSSTVTTLTSSFYPLAVSVASLPRILRAEGW